MYKFLVSIIFIVFAQSALATTYEAELAKFEAYEYDSMDYRFQVKRLENSETWCYEYNAVKRCVPVVTQISVLHDLNFVINEKYKADVKYDDLKKNIACKQEKVAASRLNEYRPFDLRLRFFCIEENNIIAYTFEYFPAIQGVGLEKFYYATCSSTDFDEYKLPLLRKFNSFAQSQKPKIARTELGLDSPLSGEFLIARADSNLKCNT